MRRHLDRALDLATDGAVVAPRWVRRVLISAFAASQGVTWLTFVERSHRGGPAGELVVIDLATLLFVAYAAIAFLRKAPTWLGLVAAANAILLVLVDFATFYWVMGTRQNWNMRLSHWDALFVAVGTLTTAGMGDIQPRSGFARRLLTLQMGFDLVVFTAIAGLVVYKLTASRPGDAS